MSDELNQPVTSQPSTNEGTNGVGKPSEPVNTSGMTPSQSSDYYNKTQALAQERRAFEEERSRWAQERGGYQQPTQPQNYPQQNFQPSQGQNPNNPQTFAQLVKEFGFEGAQTMVQTFNSITAPVQQQIAYAQQQLHQTQAMTLMGELRSRGKETYGSAWNEKGDAVMNKIIQYGCPLEEAWAIVNSGSERQAAIDSAYKNQAEKQNANVHGQGPAPSQGGAPSINSFGDAFAEAVRQHSN